MNQRHEYDDPYTGGRRRQRSPQREWPDDDDRRAGFRDRPDRYYLGGERDDDFGRYGNPHESDAQYRRGIRRSQDDQGFGGQRGFDEDAAFGRNDPSYYGGYDEDDWGHGRSASAAPDRRFQGQGRYGYGSQRREGRFGETREDYGNTGYGGADLSRYGRTGRSGAQDDGYGWSQYGRGQQGQGWYGQDMYGGGRQGQGRNTRGQYGLGQQGEYEQGRHGQGQRGYIGRGPKGYERSDDRLKEDICERLTDAPDIDAGEISIQVSNGKVTLSGRVDQRSTKHQVENLVDACPGVKEIDNRLSVSAPRGSSHSRDSRDEDDDSSNGHSGRRESSTGSSTETSKKKH